MKENAQLSMPLKPLNRGLYFTSPKSKGVAQILIQDRSQLLTLYVPAAYLILKLSQTYNRNCPLN